MAVETPGNLIANVPPKPQQASASACSTSSTFGSDEISVVPDVVSPRPRRWWQEQWNATGRRAPTVGAVFASGARRAPNSTTRSSTPASRGSPAKSSGQACSIVAAHEPESTTMGPSLSASAASVVSATRRASSGKPEFQAGWPQQVWPAGNVTR